MGNVVRRSARAILPNAVLNGYGSTRLVWRARKLNRQALDAESTQQRLEAIFGFEEFRPCQQKSELLAFLTYIESLRPVAVCEIGSAAGGTLCALAHSSGDKAVVISIDQDFTPARLKAFPNFRRPDQSVTCIPGNSHSTQVCSRVLSILAGRKLDVLFIDGDHSPAAVRADFEMYRTFVRPGGIIAFHDIVPDFKTRYGKPTSADSGGVPGFWQQLRRQYGATREFVESPQQDGYGIGVLTWRG